MPRKARIVLANVPHHVTQRGSRRGDVFFCDDDRRLYLDLLKANCHKYSAILLAYCLMDNHVHHILVPGNASSLAKILRLTHSRYATIVNGRQRWTGHLWQERYFSSALSDEYFLAAVRYVERNPVKAGLVKHAHEYRWSSASAHCKFTPNPYLGNHPPWSEKISEQKDWYQWLDEDGPTDVVTQLRENTRRDLPSGSTSFMKDVELRLGYRILPNPRGRPKHGGK